MIDIIRSNQNQNIKRIKSLQVKKYRDEYQEYIIEGEKLLNEALCYHIDIRLVVFTESFEQNDVLVQLKSKCLDNGFLVIVTDDKIFNEICETQTPQGVMAVVHKTAYDIRSILKKDEFNLMLLDEVRDPGNLGTIIRTADACNLDGVLLSKGCVDLYNGKSIRSTMGSIFHLPVIDGVDIESVVNTLNIAGVETICADPYGEVSTYEFPYYSKNAIVIGNESRGVSESLKAIIRNSVRIPMPGKAESLNAGIAAALMMYEITVRKRIIRDGRC